MTVILKQSYVASLNVFLVSSLIDVCSPEARVFVLRNCYLGCRVMLTSSILSVLYLTLDVLGDISVRVYCKSDFRYFVYANYSMIPNSQNILSQLVMS